MKKSIALVILALPVLAQTISNVTADNVTYSQARVQWNTSVNMNLDYVEWGTSSGVYPNRTVRAGASNSSVNHGVTFTVPPSSTIYYRVCSTNPSTVCSSESTFVTGAEPATEADEPSAFTRYAMPSMPTSWDKVYYVDAANCNANSTGTDTGGIQWAMDQARASTLPDSANILIKLPSGYSCDLGTTTYKLIPNVRTGGTKPAIWIVSSAWIDTPSIVPPDGVKLTSNWPDSLFYTVTPSCSTCPAVDFRSAAPSDVTKWYFRGVRFKRAIPAGATKTITAATATSPIVITAAGHGATTGDWAQVQNCTGMTGLNSEHVQVTVVDANTLSLNSTSGVGTFSGSCDLQIGVPSYHNYPLIQLDDSGAGASGTLRVKDNGFDQIKVEGPTSLFTAPKGIFVNYGDGMEIKNSYLKGTYRWNHQGQATQINNVGEAIDVTGMSNMSVVNNYINWPGISVFGQTASNGSAVNHYVARNLMEWDEKWKTDSSSSNGLRGFLRQQMEWKSADGLVVKGNIIRNSWVCCGQTGNLGGSTIVISPRATDNQSNPTLNSLSKVRDVYIGYNWIKSAAGCIYAHGAELENLSMDIRGAQRILIEHNLCSEIDARSRGNVDGSAVVGVGFYLGEAVSDLIVRRNTLIDVRGSNAAAVRWYNNRGARVVIEDNLFAGINTSQMFSWASSAITNVLPAFADIAAQSGPSLTRFQDAVMGKGAGTSAWGAWRNNYIIPGVQDGTSYSVVGGITKATCDSQFPSTGTVCLGGASDTPNQRLAMLKLPYFSGFSADNIRSFVPRYDSPVKSGYSGTSFCQADPTLCLRAKDGLDIGADIEQLTIEAGMVQNARVYSVTSTSATIGYIRPDSFPCTVEYGTSSTWGSGTRILDNSGTSRVRSVTLTGLSSGTAYNVRLLCASEQPTLAFTTR